MDIASRRLCATAVPTNLAMIPQEHQGATTASIISLASQETRRLSLGVAQAGFRNNDAKEFPIPQEHNAIWIWNWLLRRAVRLASSYQRLPIAGSNAALGSLGVAPTAGTIVIAPALTEA